MITDLEKEKALFEKAKANKKEFNDLYKYLLDSVYRFSYSLVYNQKEAEKITSQTFLAFYKELNSFEWNDVSIKFWLFKKAKVLALNIMPKGRKFQLDESYMIPDEHEISYVDDAIDSELVEKAKTEIGALHAEERSIINLRVWDKMSYLEISQLIGLTEKAARMRFNRSIQRIRDSLRKKEVHGLIEVPVLFTAISMAGVLPVYSTPSSLSDRVFLPGVHRNKISIFSSTKTFFSSKKGVAVVTSILTFVATSAAFLINDKIENNKPNQSNIAILSIQEQKVSTIQEITPTITPIPPISTLVIPSTWKTYSNDRYKFSIQYPPTWGVKETNDDSCTKTTTTPAICQYATFTSAQKEVLEFAITSTNDKGDIGYANFQESGIYSKILGQKSIDFNNNKITRLLLGKSTSFNLASYYLEGNKNINNFQVLPVDDLTLFVTLGDFTGEKPYTISQKAIDETDQIISSFKKQ